METASHDPHEDDASLREELVAYLDGELSVEQTRRIEERAAREPRTRRILEEFDRTWHLLDELESPATNEDLTRTTLEMVALAAAGDAERAKAAAPRARWRMRLWTLAGLVAAAAAGFALVAALAPDPNAQLLQDLPLLENLDQYKAVGSIGFLRALKDDDPFATEPGTTQAVPIRASGKTIAQRRQFVAGMTVKEREDLFENEKSFLTELKPEQRRRLRDLYTEIQGDRDRDKLLALMTRYWEWFSAQSYAVRNDQQQLDPAKRLAEIKKQLTLTGSEIRLDEESRAGLIRWMDFYTTQHDTRAIQEWARSRGGPGGPFGGPPRPNPNARLGRRANVRAWLRHSLLSQDAVQHPPISPDEMANLRASLSPDVRGKFDAIHKPEEQFRVIASWLREPSWPRETLRPEFEEQLADFFETKLDKEQQDRLMARPVDEMYRELGRMYYAMRQAATGGGPRPGDARNNRSGGRRGGWPGPRGSGGRRRMDDQPMRESLPPLEPNAKQLPRDSATDKPAGKADSQ